MVSILKEITKTKVAISSRVRFLAGLCSGLTLKQITKQPIRVTCHKSTFLNHILPNACEKSHSGVIDIAFLSLKFNHCSKSKSDLHEQLKVDTTKDIHK